MDVRRPLVGLVVAVAALAGTAGAADAGTWSVAATDPATGEVGVAAASCVERALPESAALIPGHAAAVAAGEQEPLNRNRLFRQLLDGRPAADILAGLADPAADEQAGERQYAVAAVDGPVVAHDGVATPPWTGSRQGEHVTVQGVGLESQAVVDDALAAFEADVGPVHLADRLVRALEAGSAAGGDRRCNNAEIRQTAASAYVMVARPNDAPYAPGAEDRNVPWLDLQVAEAKGGPNAVAELRERYDTWRTENLSPCAGCDLTAVAVPVGGTATIKETTKVGVVVLALEGLICLGVVVGAGWLVVVGVRRSRSRHAPPEETGAETGPAAPPRDVAGGEDRVEATVPSTDDPRDGRGRGRATGRHPGGCRPD